MESRQSRVHHQVCGMALAQEARVGSIGAPRARGGGQRDAADHAEQHRQGQQPPPLPAQFGAQPQPHRSHVRHSAARASAGQGCRHPRRQ